MVEGSHGGDVADDTELVVTDYTVYHDELNDGVLIECSRCSYKTDVTGMSLNEINGLANDHAELAHG